MKKSLYCSTWCTVGGLQLKLSPVSVPHSSRCWEVALPPHECVTAWSSQCGGQCVRRLMGVQISNYLIVVKATYYNFIFISKHTIFWKHAILQYDTFVVLYSYTPPLLYFYSLMCWSFILTCILNVKAVTILDSALWTSIPLSEISRCLALTRLILLILLLHTGL